MIMCFRKTRFASFASCDELYVGQQESGKMEELTWLCIQEWFLMMLETPPP